MDQYYVTEDQYYKATEKYCLDEEPEQHGAQAPDAFPRAFMILQYCPHSVIKSPAIFGVALMYVYLYYFIILMFILVNIF
jgi:hypothetical protein